MTERPIETGSPTSRRPSARDVSARAARRFGDSLVLFPRSVLDAGRTLGGHTPDGLSRGRALARAGVGMLLGLIGLIELGLLALFVARGVGYGFVDPGPYDDSWGGPTLAGAWIVHFIAGLGAVAAGVIVGNLVMGLFRRITDRLHGRPAPAWTVPVTVVLCALSALFVVAWSRQV